MERWWYVIDNKKCGPVAFKEISTLFRQGVVRTETLIWTTGMPDWQPFGSLPLFTRLSQNLIDENKPTNLVDTASLKKNAFNEIAHKYSSKNAVIVISVFLTCLSLLWLVYYLNVSNKNNELVAQTTRDQLAEQEKMLAEAKQKALEAEDALAKKAAEADLAKQQAAAAQAKADAEANLRAEAEARATASRGKATDPPNETTNQSQSAIFCKDFATCFDNMLSATMPLNENMLEQAATKILSLNTYDRGDRKAARDLNQRGLTVFNLGNYSEAVNLFKQAGDADPGDVEIWANLGYAYIKNNQPDLSTKPLGHALTLNPKRTSTWTVIAEYFSLVKNLDLSTKSLLLGYRYSGSPVNTIKFYRDKAESELNYVFKNAYKNSLEYIYSDNAGYGFTRSDSSPESSPKIVVNKDDRVKQRLTYTHGTYFGEVVNGKANGQGIYTSKLNGTTYSGQFISDTFNGYGVMQWADGSRYTGDWQDDVSANGLMTFPDGRTAKGSVINMQFQVEKNAVNSDSTNQNVSYGMKVLSCIKSGVSFPAPVRNGFGNPQVKYRAQIKTDGTVSNIRLIESSGIGGFDRAVEVGISRCSPLPRPPSGSYPPEINVTYSMYE